MASEHAASVKAITTDTTVHPERTLHVLAIRLSDFIVLLRVKFVR